MVSPVLQRRFAELLLKKESSDSKRGVHHGYDLRTGIERVNYADVCLTLPLFTWLYTVWTDEGYFTLTGLTDTWITRRRNEGYNPENMVPKFKGVSFRVMVRIAFTARAICRPVFWEKRWGKITSASYTQHVVPILAEFVARVTITEMQNRGLHLLVHPSSSPDLNLAEHPIGKIKYNLMNRQERRPTYDLEMAVLPRFVLPSALDFAVHPRCTAKPLRCDHGSLSTPQTFEGCSACQRRSNSILAIGTIPRGRRNHSNIVGR
jgi:hypothetical protein